MNICSVYYRKKNTANRSIPGYPGLPGNRCSGNGNPGKYASGTYPNPRLGNGYDGTGIFPGNRDFPDLRVPGKIPSGTRLNNVFSNEQHNIFLRHVSCAFTPVKTINNVKITLFVH